MRLSRAVIPALLISLAALSIPARFLFAQEGKPAGQDEVSSGEPDILWLWGEVSSVDADKGIVTVRYLDYETDTEKEAFIYTDAKTVYENVGSVSDIKPKDIVSIDYIAGAQGSSVARNISVEKPDESQQQEGQPAAEGAKPASDAAVSPEGASADRANTTTGAAAQ